MEVLAEKSNTLPEGLRVTSAKLHVIFLEGLKISSGGIRIRNHV